MANKNLFKSASSVVPVTNTVNRAGGASYSLSAKEALAQYATTGTFNGTFYAQPIEQLKEVKKLLDQVEPEFVAKLAIYSRQNAWLKDMPAFFTAYLSSKDINLTKKIFSRSINNGKMLRNFAQVIRSGEVGRKSFGTALKRSIQNWFETSSDEQIFAASIGNSPSLGDIIKMVHPKPQTKERSALYAYITGMKYNESDLPKVVQQFELFKKDPENNEVPKIDFQFLTALNLNKKVWKEIAKNASWHNARMNINTYERHGVFEDSQLTKEFAAKLKDKDNVKRSKVFPYQLLSAYIYMNSTSLDVIRNALHDAMEFSTENVPSFGDKKISIGVDVSGSMQDPITGRYVAVPSKIKCVDVAGLIASVIKRCNDNVSTYQFDTKCIPVVVDGRDTIMTNAKKLAKSGGGTACSSFIELLNQTNAKSDIVFVVSDNMSWSDCYGRNFYINVAEETKMMKEWKIFKRNNPNAKMILIDIIQNNTTQAPSTKDIMNISGWNDNMFSSIADFINGESGMTATLKQIETIQI